MKSGIFTLAKDAKLRCESYPFACQNSIFRIAKGILLEMKSLKTVFLSYIFNVFVVCFFQIALF